MGGAEWRDQFANGSPTPGELAEPGAYPVSPRKIAEPISRGELFKLGASKSEPGTGGAAANAPKLLEEAQVRVAEGWLRGPHKWETDSRSESCLCEPRLPFRGSAG